MCEQCGLDVFSCQCWPEPSRGQLATEFGCCLASFGALAALLSYVARGVLCG